MRAAIAGTLFLVILVCLCLATLFTCAKPAAAGADDDDEDL
jgi:hypothetical protein